MDTSTMKYPFGRCWRCGKEFNSELRGEYHITHCPYCGTEIDDMFYENVTQESQDHFCEECGLRIYEQVGKGGSWITRDDGDKQSGVCSGPCERELCARCGNWDENGECENCAKPCQVCPVKNCKTQTQRENCYNPCAKCPSKDCCIKGNNYVRTPCDEYNKFQVKVEEYKDDVKTGWWKVSFDIRLNDEEVRFEDISETSQEHIINCIKDGCNQGQLFEDVDEKNPFNGREDERECHCSNCLVNFREGQIRYKDEEEFCPACGEKGCIADGKTTIDGVWNYDPCDACEVHSEAGCRGCLKN
jgi:hypothetical protein